MLLIPAWHISVLCALYAAEYVFRFLWEPEKRFISLGKAFGRLLLTGVYLYLAIERPPPAQAQVLVRWSLTSFLLIDLAFILQEHLMQRYIHKDP
jgi:hypothetical protein